jgi:hypothetical protein
VTVNPACSIRSAAAVASALAATRVRVEPHPHRSRGVISVDLPDAVQAAEHGLQAPFARPAVHARDPQRHDLVHLPALLFPDRPVLIWSFPVPGHGMSLPLGQGQAG